MGKAYEHKCKQVLDPSCVPNPNNPDEIVLFGLQQRFMYSIFAKTMVEGKAADVLCEYSDPREKMKFGDAQKVYANLCNFCKGGAMTCMSAATLESCLTSMRLSEIWTKMVSMFICTVLHLIRDHKEATQGIHTDNYCIKKLNATFFEHKDMATCIQTMETQDAMSSRQLGTTIAPCTYDDLLHELLDYATLVDNQYAKSQSQRQNANNTKVSNGNGNNGGQQGSRGTGSQGVVVMEMVVVTAAVDVVMVMVDVVQVVMETMKDVVGLKQLH